MSASPPSPPDGSSSRPWQACGCCPQPATTRRSSPNPCHYKPGSWSCWTSTPPNSPDPEQDPMDTNALNTHRSPCAKDPASGPSLGCLDACHSLEVEACGGAQ